MQRRVAPFVLTQLASFMSVTAGSMVFIAIPWIALEISGSAAQAGLVVALTAIPGLVVIPVIGSIIDKYGRRRVAVWAEIVTGGTHAAAAFGGELVGANNRLASRACNSQKCSRGSGANRTKVSGSRHRRPRPDDT